MLCGLKLNPKGDKGIFFTYSMQKFGVGITQLTKRLINFCLVLKYWSEVILLILQSNYLASILINRLLFLLPAWVQLVSKLIVIWGHGGGNNEIRVWNDDLFDPPHADDTLVFVHLKNSVLQWFTFNIRLNLILKVLVAGVIRKFNELLLT